MTRILDFYCCEGGASRGYERAGFRAYGVDLFTSHSRKRYPYPAVRGDALDTLRALLRGHAVTFDNGENLTLAEFDAAHASPPCQHASAGTRAQRARGDNRHPALIEPTRELLAATGLPYVIENVAGAALRNPLLLCGTHFQLRAVDTDGTPLELWRHRLFESNVLLAGPPTGCQHHAYSKQVAGSYGGARRDKTEARTVRHGGYVPEKAVQEQLLGIDWMTEKGLHQALPPAYCEFIGYSLLWHIEHRRTA